MRHSMRMLVKDLRSQDGKDDKDNDKGSKSRSQSMKEQTYNYEQRERPRPHKLNDKRNLIDLMKESEFPQLYSGLVVPTFQQREDPIDCINKAMAFISVVASRFPSSNNQLRTSSSPRNQATIQDGRVMVQQVQGKQTQSFDGT
ncbi:hypothetical protein Tco_1332737 [Tanacetum coccineum]